MANLSTAHGTVTITAETRADVEQFITEALTPWANSTTDYRPDFDTEHITWQEGTSTVSASIPFSGTGRWSWEATLGDLDIYLPEYDETDYLPELKDSGKTLTAVWNFADADEATDMLYTATVETKYDPVGFTARTLECVDYDCTRENLEALGFEVEDDEEEEDEDWGQAA